MSQLSPAEQSRQIVEAAFRRWATTGAGFFDEVLAADVVWTIKGSGPSAGTFHGRDAFIEGAVRPFATRMSTAVRPLSVRVWADGDHVIVNWDGEGVARDGEPYRNSYAWILRMRDGKAVKVTAFLDLVPYDAVLQRIPAQPDNTQTTPPRRANGALTADDTQQERTMQHPYSGMWVTGDGQIRQELLPNGRYDEARGSRQSAYQGRYEVKGTRIDYWDDTGFTADGTFVNDDELHHGGMIFYRRK